MTDIELLENVSLKPFNTFGVEAKARYFVTIRDDANLTALLTDPQWNDQPKFILGGGSNVLFTQDFQGLVINMATQGIELVDEDTRHLWLKVAAGENWHHLVLHCVSQGYGGIENLSLIPGNAGAAPLQNIGAYGVELKQSFEHLEAIKISDGVRHTFNNEDCHFGYRDSIFKHSHKNQYIILNMTLRLNKKPTLNISYGAVQETLKKMGIDQPNLKAVSDAVIAIRQHKLPDPKHIGNAGSFFKNPVISETSFEKLQKIQADIPHYPMPNAKIKIPAAWLIEQCGWKGKRVGNAGVHERQALVLVNHGAAEGAEIKQLADDIQTSVLQRFGIILNREVNIQ